MKQDATRNAAYTVDCEDYVHVVEFNPFESGDSGNLIAYGGNNFVFIGTCTFQVSVQSCPELTVKIFHWWENLHNLGQFSLNFESILSLHVKKKVRWTTERDILVIYA